MSATEQEISPYELLSIKQDATEQEIKTSYRQRSLKVHPDRVCFVHIVLRSFTEPSRLESK